MCCCLKLPDIFSLLSSTGFNRKMCRTTSWQHYKLCLLPPLLPDDLSHSIPALCFAASLSPPQCRYQHSRQPSHTCCCLETLPKFPRYFTNLSVVVMCRSPVPTPVPVPAQPPNVPLPVNPVTALCDANEDLVVFTASTALRCALPNQGAKVGRLAANTQTAADKYALYIGVQCYDMGCEVQAPQVRQDISTPFRSDPFRCLF
jgi:hypothetical protein